jgi:hypothetical protein
VRARYRVRSLSECSQTRRQKRSPDSKYSHRSPLFIDV